MTAGTATDEVTDAIAYIEMHRQEMHKESGLAVACGEALRRLHELLEQEKAAPGPHASDGGYQANIEAAALEIQRIQGLAGAKRQGAPARNRRPDEPHWLGPGRPNKPGRNKGRRQMGRRGER